MSRVKIEDLKPEAKELNAKEMKKLFGGMIYYPNINPSAIQTQESGIIDRSISSAPMPEAGPAPTLQLVKI